jgi:hypothetical protein
VFVNEYYVVNLPIYPSLNLSPQAERDFKARVFVFLPLSPLAGIRGMGG